MKIGIGLGLSQLRRAGESVTILVDLSQVSNGTVTESAAQGTDLGTISATGGTGPYEYTLSGDDAEFFQINVDGETLECSATAMVFADAGTRYITITAEDANGATGEATFSYEVAEDTDNETELPPDTTPETTYTGTTTVSALNGGVKIKGKLTGSGGLVYPIVSPQSGHTYIFGYVADYSLLTSQGKSTLTGFAFRDEDGNADEYHWVGIKGDGTVSGVDVAKLTTTDQRVAPTTTIIGDPTNATQYSGLVKITLNSDGTYTYATGSTLDPNTAVWTNEITSAATTPVAGGSFGADSVGLGFYTPETGSFTIQVTTWTVGDPNFASVSLLTNWTGANGSTTADDASANNHTISFANGASIQDNALDLDGTNDRVSILDHASLRLGNSTFTLEVQRVRFDEASLVKNYVMFCKWVTPTFRSYTLQWQGSTETLVFIYSTDGTNSTSISATWTPTLATEYDICVERSGNTIRIYVDGVMLTSATAAVTMFATTASVRIGNINSSGSEANFFHGQLGEIRLTKGVARYASDSGYTPPAAFPRA